MRFLQMRLARAVLFATLWIGWAVWANVPHYYDAQAAEQMVAAVVGLNNVRLEPASAGFPFAYMRYGYSDSGQLSIYDTAPSALLPNVLFSLAGTLGGVLLIARPRHKLLPAIALLCGLVSPAALFYIRLGGLHPDVINYLYLAPTVVLLTTLAADMIRQGEGNQARIENAQSSAAIG